MTINSIDPSPVAPEYRELHELYCYFTDVDNALMRQAGRYLDSHLFAEIMGSYARLANDVAAVLILLQQRIASQEPSILTVWREACDAVNLGDPEDCE